MNSENTYKSPLLLLCIISGSLFSWTGIIDDHKAARRNQKDANAPKQGNAFAKQERAEQTLEKNAKI